jgi:hypothetical protein
LAVRILEGLYQNEKKKKKKQEEQNTVSVTNILYRKGFIIFLAIF